MRYLGRDLGARGDVLLVRCSCGLIIRHPAGEYRVRCACGASEEVAVVRRRGGDETVEVECGEVKEWP